MKRNLLALLFVAFAGAASAQVINGDQATGRSSIYVQVGPSLPLGAFKNNNPESDQAGFAKMGYSANVAYLYRLTKSFGLMADGRVRMYKQDLSRYNRNDDTYTSDKWRLMGLNIGVYQSIPLSGDERFGVQFREAAGVQVSKTPQITTSLNGVSGSAMYQTYSVSGTSFSYLLGLGFHYAVSDAILLRVFADYNGTNAGFDEAHRVPRNYSEQNLKQKIATLETGIGVGFAF